VTPDSCQTHVGTVPTEADESTAAEASVEEDNVNKSPPAERTTANAARNFLP